jgi:hypothetical protein
MQHASWLVRLEQLDHVPLEIDKSILANAESVFSEMEAAIMLKRPKGGRVLEGREWHKFKGASAEALVLLKSVAPADLPESYYSLLSFSNGGEGPLAVQPLWLCLYPAEEVAQIERDGTFKEFFENLFVIGGNGGGEAVAFDLRKEKPYPIVAFDMTNIDLPESVQPIAPSFDAALELIGRDDQ